eukprot:3113496-Pleurochrysis_carterae.AAC.1
MPIPSSLSLALRAWRSQKQTEATVRFVMERLREQGYTNDFTLAYQSKVGPVPWLQVRWPARALCARTRTREDALTHMRACTLACACTHANAHAATYEHMRA